MTTKNTHPGGKRRGIFITFEGPEASGKSTQLKLLLKFLKRRGTPAIGTREPGGTRLAEALRRVLLDPGRRIDPLAEIFLYEAARAQHVAEVIRPALARGAVVLCDRFYDATTAYQGFGRGLDLALVDKLNQAAAGGLRPRLTFLLDAPAAAGLKRAAQRKKGRDRMEKEKLSFHARVRSGYLRLAAREPGRFRVVAWQKGPSRVHKEVLGHLQKRFPSLFA